MSFKLLGVSQERSIRSGRTVDSLFEGKKLQGTKWSHVSTGRTGFNTLMDAPILEDHMKTERRNMGDGFIRLQIPDYDPSKSKPVNIGGRLVFPDRQGIFTIIDSSVVTKMQKLEEEKRAYLESLIERASLSDEICQLILGMETDNELKAALGAGRNDGGNITDPALVAVNALPSALETYDPSSITYSQAIAKFKQVIKSRTPILDNLTPASTQNQEA